ncbi:MAG: hypothetical protein ACRDQ5_00780 [Sciscionella sp.]
MSGIIPVKHRQHDDSDRRGGGRVSQTDQRFGTTGDAPVRPPAGMFGDGFCVFGIGSRHLSGLFSALGAEPRGDPDAAAAAGPPNRHTGLIRTKNPRNCIPTTLETLGLYRK